MESKPVWQSKTMWGAVLTLVPILLRAFGREPEAIIVEEQSGVITDNILLIVGSLGTLLVIIGTMFRKTTLTMK